MADTTRLSQRSMAFVLAGGRGSRLKELTDRRVKPAVYFGGKTRIIDFALSNAVNSGIRKMAVATQYTVMDLSALLASVGGSLGLYLGFSVLQFMKFLLEKVARLLAVRH